MCYNVCKVHVTTILMYGSCIALYQILHYYVVPGTVNVVRGGTDVREVSYLKKDQETDQSATSYEVIDDIDFPFLPMRCIRCP